MLIKIAFFFSLLVPLAALSQSVGKWKLYINQQEVLLARGDSVQDAQVHYRSDTTIQFEFTGGDTGFIRKIVVMNGQRNGIDSKKLTANANDAVFDIKELYRQSNGENITFYVVDVPADPAKAALVRVAPRPFCNLRWIE